MKQWKSEGKGEDYRGLLAQCGDNVIIEDGVRIFHPERVFIGNNVYIGHDTIIKGYYKHDLVIGDNSWIGQMCFIHGAGGVTIGQNVGIGPCVKIHAAYHIDMEERPILFSPLEFSPIEIKDGCNIGIGVVIMAGSIIGENTKIGANAVVKGIIPPNTVAVGIPAKVIKMRK